MPSLNRIALFSLALLIFIPSSTWAQAEPPNTGFSIIDLLANSCNPQRAQTRHTALQPSQLTCACYDAHSSYAPDVWDNAVNSCYQYMEANIASWSTDDLFSINGGTAAPALWSEFFGGLCTKYASAPSTNTATTTARSAATVSSTTTSGSGTAAATTSMAGRLQASPMRGAYVAVLLGLVIMATGW